MDEIGRVDMIRDQHRARLPLLEGESLGARAAFEGRGLDMMVVVTPSVVLTCTLVRSVPVVAPSCSFMSAKNQASSSCPLARFIAGALRCQISSKRPAS